MHLQGLKNVAWGEIASGGNRISHDRHGNTEFHSFGLQTTPRPPLFPLFALLLAYSGSLRVVVSLLSNWANVPHFKLGQNASQ